MSLQEGMVQDFCSALGKRALVLLASYPFFVVGKVKEVGKNYVLIDSEFGVPHQLKGVPFTIRFNRINAYFADDGIHKIPEFDNYDRGNRG